MDHFVQSFVLFPTHLHASSWHPVTQDLYLPDYHGLWHERLALDLDQETYLDDVRSGMRFLKKRD